MKLFCVGCMLSHEKVTTHFKRCLFFPPSYSDFPHPLARCLRTHSSLYLRRCMLVSFCAQCPLGYARIQCNMYPHCHFNFRCQIIFQKSIKRYKMKTHFINSERRSVQSVIFFVRSTRHNLRLLGLWHLRSYIPHKWINANFLLAKCFNYNQQRYIEKIFLSYSSKRRSG